MEFRKLISFGKSSFVVSLPKRWVLQQKLKKGDLVYFDEQESNLLLRAQQSQETEIEKTLVIPVDKKELKQIKREIIAAYINNTKTLTLVGEEVKEKTKDLQSMIQSLIALEIMEQTPKKIVAKDFLNLNDVSTKTIVRKIDVIIRSMFEDCQNMFKEDNCDSINARDHDVNKLIFLLFRIIKYGLENYSYLVKRLNVQSVDLLYLWWLAFELESIGDDLKRMARSMQKIELTAVQQHEYEDIVMEIKKTYYRIMKAYYEMDPEAIHSSINEREKWLEKCDEFFLRYRPVQGIAFLVYHTKACIGHVHHIGRLLYQLKTTSQ